MRHLVLALTPSADAVSAASPNRRPDLFGSVWIAGFTPAPKSGNILGRVSAAVSSYAA